MLPFILFLAAVSGAAIGCSVVAFVIDKDRSWGTVLLVYGLIGAAVTFWGWSESF